MRAERRHDLKTNTLARRLEQLPEIWRLYGGKILAGLIIVLLAIIAVRLRITTSRNSLKTAFDNLSTAQYAVHQLRDQQFETAMRYPPDQVARLRKQLVTIATDALAAVERTTVEDPQLQAEALVAKGDLNWAIASLPEIPAATTQPALQLGAPDEALRQAAESYQQILDKYADQPLAVAAARMGLAAIAENQGQWDKARGYFEAVANDKSVPALQRQLAADQLTGLPQLEHPILLAAPATQATTLPVAELGTEPAGQTASDDQFAAPVLPELSPPPAATQPVAQTPPPAPAVQPTTAAQGSAGQ